MTIKMISMKRKPVKPDKNDEPGCCGDNEKFPWGLRVSFDSESVDKIKALQNVKAGDMVKLMSEAKVVEVSLRDTMKEGEKQRVELQLEMVGIDKPDTPEKLFKEGAG